MKMHTVSLSRRGFLGGAVAAAAAVTLPKDVFAAACCAKPNSKFNGVQIGTITYSYRGMPQSAEQVLGYLIEDGLSSVELMGGTADSFIGRPNINAKDPDANKKWMEFLEKPVFAEKCAALRKLYNDAGVNIHIVKYGDIGANNMSAGQMEYYFRVAKAVGAKGITREIDENAAKVLGPIADKHQIYIGFHNHTQINAKTYDGPILSYGKYLAINLDIGHYVAANEDCPIAIIEKYHDRILSLHLKDRTRKVNKAQNLAFGKGDTPIAGALQLMRKNGYTFPADIELEYKIPEGSSQIKEIATCVQFCKQALS